MLVACVANTNKYVCTGEAQSEELSTELVLLLVQSRNGVQNLSKAEIHKLLGLRCEVVVSDENLVVAVDEGDAVGQTLLLLRGQVPNNVHVDGSLQKFTFVCSPLVNLHQLHDSFYKFEEVRFRV